VFPCNPLNKAPLTEQGFKDATTDAFQIRSWWGNGPTPWSASPPARRRLLGSRHRQRRRARPASQSLAEHGHDLSELMDTAVANTASGGYHCLFRFDPTRPVGNSRGALKRFLDVRGEGGYIIAAGSVARRRPRYAWLNPPDENEIAEAPEWLLEASRTAATSADQLRLQHRSPARPSAGERVAAIAPGTWHENTRDLVRAWCARALGRDHRRHRARASPSRATATRRRSASS
jgi:hypothetical protein